VCCSVALALSTPAGAEEIEKKLRVGVSIGQFNTRDVQESNAANILTIVGPDQQFITFIEDPRNDDAALGQLTIRPAWRGLATVQYGINRFFLVEGTAGYQKGDVASIEMQAEFAGTYIEPIERHKYTIFSLAGGTMTQIPFRVTAVVRFRPKARFNPYLGAGGGYTVVGYEPSEELNTLSQRMDGLVGGQTTLLPNPATTPNPPAAEDFVPMTGATVQADNYWNWHLVGGAEYGLKRKWSLYVDLRYEKASTEFLLGFNGSDSVGISVPNRQAVRGTEAERAQYGPMLVETGGLVDGGLRVNPDLYENQPQPPGLCSIPDYPSCEFLLNSEMAAYNEANKDYPGFVPVEPDGILDPGYYYVQGATIKYGGTSLQFGIRYTF
jgi:opacity protein-like surface antigen